jgi:hypothetical protein
VTSAALEDGHVVALAYVRVEIPRDAALSVGNRVVRQLDLPPERP